MRSAPDTTTQEEVGAAADLEEVVAAAEEATSHVHIIDNYSPRVALIIPLCPPVEKRWRRLL